MFTQTKFLGATVRSFTTSAGWNDQSSHLTISLVEDPAVEDDFLLKTDSAANFQGQMIGTARSFQMGDFRFDGIILGCRESDSFQGRPAYEVTMTSPNLILDNAQVILSNYVGPTNNSIFHSNLSPSGANFQLSNLLNVYGYLEQGGSNFGNSLINNTGLRWEGTNGVRNALETLTSTAMSGGLVTNWGSQLAYRGSNYKLDLRGIPTAPSFYRVGGSVNMSLSELINQVCQDAGVKYMVTMTVAEAGGPHTISLRTVDQVIDPNLNQIAEYISGRLADQAVMESTVGQELRTDSISQAFIVGGDVTVLQPIENWSPSNPSVIPFWGFDVDGNPILGHTAAGAFFADDDHTMNLNAAPIADVMGSFGLPPVYQSTILEMRCALVDYDSWATYLVAKNPDLANTLGIFPTVRIDQSSPFSLFTPKFTHDFVEDGVMLAAQLGQINTNNHWMTVSYRVYNFVKEQAETYYGKKFLVRFPFPLQVKVADDTTQVTYSDEPADAGYLPEASEPLGLNFINESFFLTPDGRFSPFLRFALNPTFGATSASGGVVPLTADTSQLPAEMVVQPDPNPSNAAIYAAYEGPESGPTLQHGLLGGGNIVFVPGGPGVTVPAMVCTVQQPIFAVPLDALGSVDDIGSILNVSRESIISAATNRVDSFGMKIHPPAIYPNGVAVALKSNQYTYGPWGKWAADGRVLFERDESLTPWEYGDYNTLTQAALAKLANIPLPNQVQEAGTVREVDMPTKSLGDVLIIGGPTIGNITVTADPQGGVTTEYTMETFIPRVGKFSARNADRLKTMGLLAQQSRRAIRQLFIERKKRQQITVASRMGFLNGAAYAVRQQTSYGAIGAHLIKDEDNDKYVPGAYTQTLRESVMNIQASDDEQFLSSACMGWEGLVRPVSTNVMAEKLSHYRPIDTIIIDQTPIQNSGLHPLQPESDIIWWAAGDTYDHMNNRRDPQDTNNARLIALRGPLLVTGWGYDILGNPCPNAADTGVVPRKSQDYTDEFQTDYLNNSQNWPCGAVDLRWDKWRGVWGFPGILMGMVSGTLSPGGEGTMILMTGDGTNLQETVTIHNFFLGGTPIQDSGRVIAIPSMFDNKIYAIAADCTTS